MGIWSPAWTAPVFAEAMKFWFYSLVLSIILQVINLRALYTTPITISQAVKEIKDLGEDKKKEEVVEQSEEEKRKEKEQKDLQLIASKLERRKAIEALVVDLCNITNPGTATGWMPVTSGHMGMLMVVSTILTSIDIWARVQSC